MTHLVIDNLFRDKLRLTQDAVELIDEDGQSLGVFCPMLSPPYNASLVPKMTEDERRRRLAQPGQYSTSEVLRHLENL